LIAAFASDAKVIPDEYTIASVVAVVALVVAELRWLRTGVLRKPVFWIAYAIILFFQVLVDGWLTKLSAPIVMYNSDEFSGIRFPWDIPVEDYLFGFALIALTIMLWERAGQARGRGRDRDGAGDGATTRTGAGPNRPR
jgi:lycopene cyclase domain-containing protein